MQKCVNCMTYDVMPISDKDQPSSRSIIAAQSDSDVCVRFTYNYPTMPGTHCYYCTKKLNKRIGAAQSYGIAYDKKDQ